MPNTGAGVKVEQATIGAGRNGLVTSAYGGCCAGIARVVYGHGVRTRSSARMRAVKQPTVGAANGLTAHINCRIHNIPNSIDVEEIPRDNTFNESIDAVSSTTGATNATHQSPPGSASS